MMLLLCALVVGSTSVWATDPDEEVDFSAQGYTNSQAISSYEGSDFTVSFDKGTNSSNPPKYYTSGTAIRAYGGNYFTVSSTTKTIEKIVITFGTTGDGSNAITTDEESYEDGTWTGSASSVKFTIGGTSGNRRIAGLAIYYASSSGSNPSISADNVNITSGATGGSISYTINNAVTGGALTAAKTSESDWLTVGAVSASAVAFTTEANTGAARSATVRLTYTYNTNQTVTKDVTVTQAVYVAPVEFTALYGSFDDQESVGGNTGGFATCSNSSLSTYDNWTLTRVYPADRCFKVGTSSSGSIETPALKLNSEVTYVLTFKAAPWSSDGTTLTLSSSDAIFGGKTSKAVTMNANKWTSYYIELTAGLPTSKVKFTPAKRCFLDEVRVMEKSAFEALTASKTVESYGWATYIPDYAVEFESGDAYIVTAILNTDLTLEGVTKVPAKTPVLLKGAGDKTITVINDASVAAPASISLLTIGNGKALESGEYPYVLAKNGEGACFKLWEGAMSSLNGRVMLVLDEAVATARTTFELDDATGISEVETIKQNHEGYYNLAGQRVAQPTKGLYIVNGKKVVIK